MANIRMSKKTNEKPDSINGAQSLPEQLPLSPEFVSPERMLVTPAKKIVAKVILSPEERREKRRKQREQLEETNRVLAATAALIVKALKEKQKRDKKDS